MERGLNIAVVGSGIAGLGAAWLASRAHRVTLFEREARIGGHSNTVDARVADGVVAVDTGFIVYNTASYPNLIALFDHLGVETAPTSMGFAVSVDGGTYEYSGNSLAGFVGTAANLASPAHWRLMRDTLRFFREATALAARADGETRSLGDYLRREGYSAAFIDRHILPMAAAIWSTPSADVLAFPVASFARFFANHGLLQVANRPPWRTVVGGSRNYVRRLLDDADITVERGTAVAGVARDPEGVTIMTARGPRRFDAVVMASHADETLALLADADARERAVLGAFHYTPNRAVLHTDPSFMPKRRRLWSAWNYLGAGAGRERHLALTYWMNALQPLPTREQVFVTLNPARPIASGREIAAFDYTHPMFDAAAMAAQRELWGLQGRNRTWFCGAYCGYGFHEDGLQSGLAVAEEIGGVRRPWNVAGESSRLDFSARVARSPLAPGKAAA